MAGKRTKQHHRLVFPNTYSAKSEYKELVLPNKQKIDDFYVITINNAAAIVAIDEDGNCILKKEYRYCYDRDLIEVPAGTFEEDETDGYCLNTLHSYTFEGSAGFEKMQNIMVSFRKSITEFAGKKVLKCLDYSEGIDGLDQSSGSNREENGKAEINPCFIVCKRLD